MTAAAIALAAVLGAGAVLPASTLDWAARAKDPARDRLPDDAALAEQIRLGYAIFVQTPERAPALAAARLNCGSCHLNAGQKEGALPLVGVAAAYPEPSARAGRPLTLEERIVGCFLRSLNAPGLRPPSLEEHENAAPHPSSAAPEVRALAAYLRWLSEGTAIASDRASRAPHLAAPLPLAQLDPDRGARLFSERCSTCHGLDGQGRQIGEVRPGPLWGPLSWNDGAGVSRTLTLAAFLRRAMPYTAPGTLSDEEAQQIAAYLTSKPRPVFAAKSLDYLSAPLPADAVYYPRR